MRVKGVSKVKVKFGVGFFNARSALSHCAILHTGVTMDLLLVWYGSNQVYGLPPRVHLLLPLCLNIYPHLHPSLSVCDRVTMIGLKVELLGLFFYLLLGLSGEFLRFLLLMVSHI